MRNIRNSAGVLAVAGLCLASTSVHAVTDKTSTMAVSMTVTTECTLTANPLAFAAVGSNTLSALGAAGTSTLSIQCTSGTPYTVTMSAGGGVGATTAVRKMTSGANTLNYSIYSDEGHATIIDSTGSGMAKTADGTAQSISIYGFAPSQTVPAGAYSDSITVTLSY